ncbi:sensor histidine kinase [Paenibacillus sp. NPDC057967]|uniref:sensor histidine kinase n=1 Tax=Paenibacillus sp. NPDC057967 TaxID=3346293 RepID=UPI0036DC0D90
MKRLVQMLVKRLMDRRFFTKIFISILIVSFIGVFSLVYIYQQYYQGMITDNELDRTQRSINQAGYNLDNQLRRVVQNVQYFFYYSENSVEIDDASDVERLQHKLEAFRTQYSSELESVFLFIKEDREEGQETIIHDTGLDRVPDIDYRNQTWYKHFLVQETDIWSKPTKEHLFYQDRSYTSIYLMMGKYDMDGRDGMLVVRLNGKMFSDAFRLLATNDLMLELKDAKGHIVYSSFPDGSGAGDAMYLKTESKLNYSGFEVQAYTNKKAILDKVRQIQIVHPLVIIVILLITLVMSFLLTWMLTQPIKKLLQLMKKVEIGDLDVRFTSKYTDEIGLLGRNFNKMLANLSEMIDRVYVVEMEKINAEVKQKDAMLLAMQHQINPHFLYNTLEVINCQAILHEAPPISRMSRAMADFFRYTIDNPKAEVELRTEIEHVRTYLDIQRERYPDIEIDMDGLEPFGGYPIVKLTLQPIVENAFLYAFAGERDYYLKIYAEDCDEQTYALYIEDNGQGMDEQAMEAMNQLFESEAEEVPEQDDSRRRGIGLLNVQQRIRLRYGNGYGLLLEESMTGGVTVRIKLPKEGKDYENLNR